MNTDAKVRKLTELERYELSRLDFEKVNAAAEYLNQEMEGVLRFQAPYDLLFDAGQSDGKKSQ